MKRLTGWILISFCSILLLIFTIALSAIIPVIYNNSTEVQISVKEIISSSLGFLIIISLLVIGLKNGIKKVKKDKLIEIIDYDKELKINLSGQIEYIGYRNLIMGLSFRKPIYIVGLGLMILMSLSLFVNKEINTNQFDSNYFIFIFIGIFLLWPFLTLIQIRRLYNTNKIFQEKLNYSLNNDSIHIKGETVDSRQKWTHFYQIRETKAFFMLYHDKIVSTLLDKKMFSENDLHEFKDFIKSLNVKKI